MADIDPNGYLLNALPTTGSYNPVFADGQLLLDFELSDNLNLSILGHYSSNLYRFKPQTQETDFGTANEAYSFRVYFEGGGTHQVPNSNGRNKTIMET